MALNSFQLNIYTEKLNELLKGKTITRPVLFTENSLYFLILNGQNEYLSLCMDQENPRIYIGDSYQKFKSLENNFFSVVNKELSRAYIYEVELINNDRIIRIKTYILNDIFEEEIRYIYLELIPHHPNLILTKEDNSILTVYKQSPLTSNRPLMRNIKYEPPLKGNFVPKELPFDFDEYTKTCLSQEDTLYSKRKKNLYGSIEKQLKQELKTLKHKQKALKKDQNLAQSHLNDGEIGNYILTMQSELRGKSEFDYYGSTIKIDPRLNIFSTANKYFSNHKKAKRQLENIDKNISKLERDLASVNKKIFLYQNGTFEEIEDLLVPEYTKNKKAKKKQKRQPTQFKLSELPYVVKDENGTSYLYGKNRIQNDKLTFYIDKSPNHIWIHPLGVEGSHLIIKKDNPSDTEINIGCQLALLATGLTDGQLMVAKRESIYRNGGPGSVKVLDYKVIRINEISENIKTLFDSQDKYKL